METDKSQYSHAGKKVTAYTTKFKLADVQFAEECNSNHQAATTEFNVDRKRIREWRQNKSKLESVGSAAGKQKRLEGGGRKPFDEAIEEVLFEWVHQRRANGLRVSRKIIRSKAGCLHEEKCKETEIPPTFTASVGWVQKFMTRNGLSIRRKTTQSQKNPEKLIVKLISYVLQMRRLRETFSYGDSDIVAMDETAV